MKPKPVRKPTRGTNRGGPKFNSGTGHAAGGKHTIVVNGQTIEIPDGQTWVPGSAGVLNPTTKPFQTGDDMLTAADDQFNLEDGLYNLDTALDKLRIDTDFQKKEITKSEGQAKSATIDNMIARGLFRSSVKDGEIYDIQATASMRRNFLDTALSTAEIETGVRKGQLRSRHDAIQSALARKSVENAQAADDGAPDYLVEPTEGHLTPKPKASTPKPKPAPKPRAVSRPKLKGPGFKSGTGYAKWR
jgi:hypothetical protein